MSEVELRRINRGRASSAFVDLGDGDTQAGVVVRRTPVVEIASPRCRRGAHESKKSE